MRSMTNTEVLDLWNAIQDVLHLQDGSVKARFALHYNARVLRPFIESLQVVNAPHPEYARLAASIESKMLSFLKKGDDGKPVLPDAPVEFESDEAEAEFNRLREDMIAANSHAVDAEDERQAQLKEFMRADAPVCLTSDLLDIRWADLPVESLSGRIAHGLSPILR